MPLVFDNFKSSVPITATFTRETCRKNETFVTSVRVKKILLLNLSTSSQKSNHRGTEITEE